MIARIVIFFIGIFLLPAGWHEASLAWKYSKPVEMSCQQLLSAAEKPGWVKVDDCVVYFGQFQTVTNQKTNAVTSIAVMVFPSVEAAEDKTVKSSVVINISDSGRVHAANENLDKLNQLIGVKTEAAQKEAADRYKKLFESGPLILKEETVNEDFTFIKERLAPTHNTYAYSSLDDKPSMLQGILMMIGGVVVAALVVWSFIKRKK